MTFCELALWALSTVFVSVFFELLITFVFSDAIIGTMYMVGSISHITLENQNKTTTTKKKK